MYRNSAFSSNDLEQRGLVETCPTVPNHEYPLYRLGY